MRKFFLFLFVSIFSINFSNAQDYYFKHFQVEEGLSNNTVLTSIQDNDGFMWFGTKDGLNRFDGYRFKTYRSNGDPIHSLGSNYIQSMHECDGTIWVGTDKGLYHYDKKQESFTVFNEAINDRINDINHDKKGNIWFLSGNILYKYAPKKKETTTFNTNKYFPTTSIAPDPKGEIWASSYNKIYHYSEENLSFENFPLNPPANKANFRITVIFVIDNENIAIGTQDHGILIYNRKTRITSELKFDVKEPVFVRQFKKRGNDELWIASESGVYVYNLKTKTAVNLIKNYNDPYAISDNASYSITIDKEDGIWIGTYFGGINYHQKQYTQFKKYFPQKGQNSISGSAVREIHKDEKGDLWIGTEDAGVNRFNIKTKKFTSYLPNGTKSGVSYYNIHALLPRKDKIWVGTFEHGLDVLDRNTGAVIKHYSANDQKSGLQSNFIFSFYGMKNKDLIVVTTRGLYRYNEQADNFEILKFFPETYHYTNFKEDSDGNLWAGSYRDGLLFYNPKTKKKEVFIYDYKNPKSISNNTINTIFEDSSNNLWIATENGLNLVDRKTHAFKKITTNDGMPSNVFYSILEDDTKNLWLTTSKGLVKFGPDHKTIKIFTTANGLLSDQFNYNSAFEDTNGDMYFGNLNGMISFNPKHFSKNKYTPFVYITNLQINNKDIEVNSPDSPIEQSISFLDELELNNSQSSFNLEFASLNFTAPELTEYWYQLENVNNDWVYLGRNNKVFFTELAPGDYVFKVKSLNSFGVWSKEVKLKIRILPPFYASTYAYLLYFLLICAGFYYIIRYSQNLTQIKNNRKIKHLNDEKEKEIYQAKIDFFTNVAHEIRTPLTLIKGPLEKLLGLNHELEEVPQHLSIMKKNTSRLLKLVNELLDFRKSEIGGLKLTFVEANISSMVRNFHLRFSQLIEERELEFELELGEKDIHAFVDKEAFKKILSNLINNAIKYSNKTVSISLFRDEKKLTLIVKNDGKIIPNHLKNKIFEPFFRVDENSTASGTGIGLSLAHSLAQLHNGSLELVADSTYNIFELVVPLHQEQEFMLYSDSEKEQTENETPKETVEIKNEKAQILVVEDNEDLLSFITTELASTYAILKAENGEEALKIIHNENIQLVISDVTMPVMDGITMCKKIKTNLETSHIPVILLTAKNSLKSQIDGLEVGADAYIAKPFSMDYLKVQANNLIENRRQIMNYYASSPLSHIKSIAHNKTDEKFLKKLDDEILKNITDQDLSVESLAEIMNMSRSTLYRKIKDITNLSPNELINIVRLKRAAELLLNENYKMYEIAEMVGYKSQTSFGRNFQKHFNMSPSEYIQANR
ncbi:ligand-binding sensor domain-containing protein/signal transduction histidine kinase/DNA-binding response OmpR family regulator [Flavobacterium nitrogenifigens]|uniref:histidine kinase n=2 Tax=Flavobacterium TaxID=237 RepID=A0A7W7IYR5_9FLAO|nr:MULTISPECIES: two-component regulator propeller domain-containing protein [Flavobacterium]MBB4802768.1 ligand-binding sensor domain-containing protein/signal transduction histidine kinase/DNA-binding response OmpR family regulator [Flavobacterium nitrogenifigens]MBB6387726.1 ligand-binding sensor domain-containing protein/signal transduction histidine kinase/DNA-binding response OmpR family regulator [Flavobacterium notoginsengisoli]